MFTVTLELCLILMKSFMKITPVGLFMGLFLDSGGSVQNLQNLCKITEDHTIITTEDSKRSF